MEDFFCGAGGMKWGWRTAGGSGGGAGGRTGVLRDFRALARRASLMESLWGTTAAAGEADEDDDEEELEDEARGTATAGVWAEADGTFGT